VALERVLGPRAPDRVEASRTAPSGAWFCPHGGGSEGWSAALTVANPGPEPVQVRVKSLGAEGFEAIGDGELLTVPGASQLTVPVPADGRARSTVVEYFGGWVAAGWTEAAVGEERGLAGEPCVAFAGRSWLLPDGITLEGQQAYVVVMNPFDTDAVFSLTLVTENRKIRTRAWTDYVLPAHRSAAFQLNKNALGERTVATEVDVSIGRVAAGSLGIVDTGGIRSVVGLPGGGHSRLILPGGGDLGQTDLVVLNPTDEDAAFEVALQGSGSGPAGTALPEESLPPGGSATYDLATEGPTTLDLRSTGDGGVVAVRRTVGSAGDQGATRGANAPRGAWVLLPGGTAGGAVVRVFLANPGAEPVRVTLTPLATPDGTEAAQPVTIEVPSGSTVAVPADSGLPGGSVLAVAESGGFVPVVVSYPEGGDGYSVALGVPIPARWIPA
jgi:hypothetical protein